MGAIHSFDTVYRVYRPTDTVQHGNAFADRWVSALQRRAVRPRRIVDMHDEVSMDLPFWNLRSSIVDMHERYYRQGNQQASSQRLLWASSQGRNFAFPSPARSTPVYWIYRFIEASYGRQRHSNQLASSQENQPASSRGTHNPSPQGWDYLRAPSQFARRWGGRMPVSAYGSGRSAAGDGADLPRLFYAGCEEVIARFLSREAVIAFTATSTCTARLKTSMACEVLLRERRARILFEIFVSWDCEASGMPELMDPFSDEEIRVAASSSSLSDSD